MLCYLMFFFCHFFASPSLLPLTHPRLSLYSISMKARYVLGEGGCMCVAVHGWAHCSIVWMLAGWLGPRLANGCSGDFGWGSAIAPSYRFPHEGLPYHPSPERSPFFSHPRDTLPHLLPPHPPFPSLLHLLLIPHPPPIPSFHIHPALRRATFNQEGGWRRREGDEGGGGFKDSLSHKHTHTLGVHGCVFACVRSICQNSFSSVIGLGVPVSMR